jgi:hypothetical protein
MTNKIAGLYVQLAKSLNNLEEAGEDPWIPGLSDIAEIEGLCGTVVRWDVETARWIVSEA